MKSGEKKNEQRQVLRPLNIRKQLIGEKMKIKEILISAAVILIGTCYLAVSVESTASKYLNLLSKTTLFGFNRVWRQFEKEVPCNERSAILGQILQQSAQVKADSNVGNKVCDYLGTKNGSELKLSPILLYQIGALMRSDNDSTREKILLALELRLRRDKEYIPLYLCFLADRSDAIREKAIANLPEKEDPNLILKEYLKINERNDKFGRSCSKAKERLNASKVENQENNFTAISNEFLKKLVALWSEDDGNDYMEGKMLLKKQIAQKQQPALLVQLWEYSELCETRIKSKMIKGHILAYATRFKSPKLNPCLTYFASLAATSTDKDLCRMSAIVFYDGNNQNWPMLMFSLSSPSMEARSIAMTRVMSLHTSEGLAVLKSYSAVNGKLAPNDPLLSRTKSYIKEYSSKSNEK